MMTGGGLVHHHDPCQQWEWEHLPKWGQGAWGSVEQNGRIWESGFGSACPRFLPACAATNNPSHGAFMATPGLLSLCFASNSTEDLGRVV